MWRKGEEPLEKLFEDSSPPLLSHFFLLLRFSGGGCTFMLLLANHGRGIRQLSNFQRRKQKTRRKCSVESHSLRNALLPTSSPLPPPPNASRPVPLFFSTLLSFPPPPKLSAREMLANILKRTYYVPSNFPLWNNNSY